MWDLHTSTPYPAHATNIRGVHCELLSFLQLALRQQLRLGLCCRAKLGWTGGAGGDNNDESPLATAKAAAAAVAAALLFA
jgi:hypothetical protein